MDAIARTREVAVRFASAGDTYSELSGGLVRRCRR
jgi:hypothetical protein